MKKPTISVKNVINIIIENFNVTPSITKNTSINNNIKSFIISNKNFYIECEKNYIHNKGRGINHTKFPNYPIFPQFLNENKDYIYTNLFNKKNKETKNCRQELLENIERENVFISYLRCPICGNKFYDRRRVQLDHYLPKSLYPEFIITPVNLLPICSSCNFAKGDKNDYIYNPYFDEIDFNKISFNFISGKEDFFLIEIPYDILNTFKTYDLDTTVNDLASEIRYDFRKRLKTTNVLKTAYRKEILISYLKDEIKRLKNNNKDFLKEKMFNVLIDNIDEILKN